MVFNVFTQLLFVQVQLFRWIDKDDGVQELQTECGYHGHILALHMQVNYAFLPTRFVLYLPSCVLGIQTVSSQFATSY